MNVIEMFEPVTKVAQPVLTLHAIPEQVRKAFSVAEAEKPGAVLLELPENIAGQELSKDEAATVVPLARPSLARRPGADDKTLDAVWQLFLKAKKPIILAGNGAIRKRASHQLTRFVDATGTYVANTFMAKGSLSADHPRSLFTVGLGQQDRPNLALDDADLVLAVGVDLVEYPPHRWNKDRGQRIIHIDFVPAETDKHYGCLVEVVGDLAHSLWGLSERADAAAAAGSSPFPRDYPDFAAIRDDMLRDFAEFAADDEETGLVKPEKVLWEVRRALGDEDILISDVGAHKMWVARYYQTPTPNTVIIGNGFCSMGIALPGIIGAKLARPDATVLAVCGDGGFLMNVQEMETIRRLGFKRVVVMVWVDSALGLIEWKQQNHFGRHTDLSFANPDFDLLARAFDWAPFTVTGPASLASTLADALAADKPALVTIPIDYARNDALTKKLGEIIIRS